jgi:GAF domain-containing protein
LQQESTPPGYLFDDQHGEHIQPGQPWLPVLSETHQKQGVVTRDAELGVELGIRGTSIGAIGLRRKDGRSSWTADEIAMIADIADELTQTIERLRLVEDISRRAALESTIGQVTARIRAEIDIESVLESALTELGEVLQAERGYVHLSITDKQEKSE